MASLHALITAVYTTALAATNTGGSLVDVEVIDGPVVTVAQSYDRLFVGSSDLPAEPGGYSTDASGQALPQYLQADALTVTCTVECWVGDANTEDMAERRARAFTILDAVRAMLAPNVQGVTLGLPSLQHAKVGRVTYTPRLTESGTVVSVVFTVDAQARVTTRAQVA